MASCFRGISEIRDKSTLGLEISEILISSCLLRCMITTCLKNFILVCVLKNHIAFLSYCDCEFMGVSIMMKQACSKDNAVGKRESAERSRGSETNGRECKTDGSCGQERGTASGHE